MTLTITVEKSRAAAAAGIARLLAYHHPDSRFNRARNLTAYFMAAVGMQHDAAWQLASRICRNYSPRHSLEGKAGDAC